MAGRNLVVRIIGDTSSFTRSVRVATTETERLDHSLGKVTRGVAAGSGAFTHLGRSLAFASGGFIAAASATDLLRGSIEQASKGVATQKQLAAQFKASGQNLRSYQEEIDRTTNRLSLLAGFEDDELKQSFITAFRGSQNVKVALKEEAIAADVARGRHISLAQSTLALAKAYGGQASALRRLGVLVPKNISGLAALNYVQAKFAGQARSGTTAQERFSATFKNMEEVVGKALLPSLDNLLNRASKWLNNSKNQKKVQEDVNKSVSVGGKLLHGFGSVVGLFSKGLGPPIRQTVRFAQAIERVNNAVNKALVSNLSKIYKATPAQPSAEDVRLRGVANMVPGTGEDVRLRSQGFVPSAPAGPVSRRVRASLDYQISRANLNLARAQVTASTADDRAMLVRLAALTREKISKTKDLAQRTQLYQSLGSIEQQIRAIDDGRLAEKKAANKKELDAKKKEAAEAKKHAEAVRAAQQKVQEAVANVRQNLASTLSTVRSGIGDLFSGPVLNPSDAQTKTMLGVPGPNGNVLVSDLKAQTAQFARLQRDLRRFKKLGASKELISELNQQGTSAIPQIEALLGNRHAARQFIGAFNQRERLALRTARMDVNATRVVVHTKELPPVHVVVELDGKVVARQVTKHQQQERKKTGSQRRGRYGGTR